MSAEKRQQRQTNAQVAAIVDVLKARYDVVWNPGDDCELTEAEYEALARQILAAI